MDLIAITVPYFYPGEGEDIVNALTARGFKRVHIRKPGCTPEEIQTLIDTIPRELRQRISLHDCLDLAEENRIGGVHLNHRNPAPPAGWSGPISRSIHSVDEIPSVDHRFSYAFLSPIFPSISKVGYSTDFDLEELRHMITPKIYALGGVTYARLHELEKAGFAGAAMLGSAWRKPLDMDAFRLQLITDGATPEAVIDGARQAVEGGCRWVQVRMKNASAETVENVVLTLAPLRKSHGVTLLVDDHVELAARLDCIDGVHVGKNDMPVNEARRMLGPKKILGATANTFADLERSVADGADYIGLGPFRFTTTKNNLSPILGIDGYDTVMNRCRRRKLTVPVVAIGGITPADIEPLMRTGVGGIAVSGAILRSENPATAAAAFMEILNGAFHPLEY